MVIPELGLFSLKSSRPTKVAKLIFKWRVGFRYILPSFTFDELGTGTLFSI
jgi:hypothetical protein